MTEYQTHLEDQAFEQGIDLTKEPPVEIDLSKINNIVFADVFHWDAPQYTDAFIDSADYYGEPMTEDQLNELNEDSDFVSEALYSHIF